MRVTYITPNNRMRFEFDADSEKTAFDQIAAIQEVFEESQCGLCQGKNVFMQVRCPNNKDVYYNLRCRDCGAELDVGQGRDGKTLFIRKFDKDTKQALPHGGWKRWQPTQRDQTPPQKPAPGGYGRDRPRT